MPQLFLQLEIEIKGSAQNRGLAHYLQGETWHWVTSRWCKVWVK